MSEPRQAATAPAPAAGPLAGYRVLELCSTIAGPTCARLFADFGAEVVKVEPPRGDSLRQLGFFEDGVSLNALSLVRNKHPVVIDLKTEAGCDLARQLAARSDIVIESFRPGTLERLGLGYDVLCADNPGLVLVRISGYGQTGPQREKAGYGAICEAYAGIRDLIGDPDRPPARVAVPVADCVSAVYAAFGAMMALLERQRSGRGQVVDTALYETMFSMMEGAVPTFDRLKLAPQRMGTRLPAMAPNNLYLAGDETYVLIAANSDAVFARLAAAMDRPALVDDPRYASAGARWQHVDELDAEVGAWVASLPAAEVEARLIAHGVPTSRVVTLPEIFEEPHYREREMLVELPHPKLGKVTVQGVVPRLSATPGRVRWLGEPAGFRTRTILRDWLNLDDAAIDTLLQNGVIAEAGAEGGGE